MDTRCILDFSNLFPWLQETFESIPRGEGVVQKFNKFWKKLEKKNVQ